MISFEKLISILEKLKFENSEFTSEDQVKVTLSVDISLDDYLEFKQLFS